MLQAKRRSTLQPGQKIKKNKQTQMFIELDKCLQIPHDDRLLIRKIIKEQQPVVLNIFEQFKKDKSFTQLQIKLRKFMQNLRNPQKKNQTQEQQYERNKTNSSQRIYSQNSQPTSYKNSLKCSPEREQEKKKVINLDITQLKKKIELTNSQRSFLFTQKEEIFYNKVDQRKENSAKKKEISITKINTYLPVKRQNNMKRLQNQYKFQQQPNKSILVGKQSKQKIKQTPKEKKSEIKYSDLSKITIKKDEKKNIENTLQTPKQKQNQTASLQEISQNYSYSSNIKNLLNAKLKEQKDPRKNSKILIQEEKIILKTQEVEPQSDYQEKNHKKEQITTIIKRPAKPLHKDEYPCSVRLFDHQDLNMPIYLKSDTNLDVKNEENIVTVRDSLKKQPSYLQLKQSLKESAFQPKKIEHERGQQNFGRFFQKIKRIMQNKNL